MITPFSYTFLKNGAESKPRGWAARCAAPWHTDQKLWELSFSSLKPLISALRMATCTNKYSEYLQTLLEGEMCLFLSCQCSFLRFRGSKAALGAERGPGVSLINIFQMDIHQIWGGGGGKEVAKIPSFDH